MKIKEHYNSFIPRIFKASAVTLGSHIFYGQAQNQVSARLRRHEMVHVEQYKKDGFFGFLYRYLKTYFKLRMQGKSHIIAYYSIPYEEEAYVKERQA